MTEDTISTIITSSNAIMHEHKLANEILNITKRELFAAMAMQGILAKHGLDDTDSEYKIAGISIASTVYADALIEQLNKISTI